MFPVRTLQARRVCTICFVFALLITALPAGQALPAAAATGVISSAPSGGDPETPIHARLFLQAPATLGQPATLTCQVSSTQDAPGTTAQIELPGNVTRSVGSLTWQGDLTANQPVEIAVTVVFTAPGDTAILCRALHTVDARNSWGDLAALYLSVSAAEIKAGFAPIALSERVHSGGLQRAGDGRLLADAPASYPDPNRIVAAPPANNPLPPPAAPAAPAAPAPSPNPKDQPQSPPAAPAAPPVLPAAPVSPEAALVPNSLTVTGNWAYYDRDDNYVGALEMLVELVRGDNGGHLAYCFTDLSGNYACGPVSNPGGVGVRTLLRSWTNYNPNGDILAVVNPDYGTTNAIGFTFPTQSGVVVFPDGTHDIGAWFVFNGSNYERAYWTQRDLNETWRFVYFTGGGGTSGPTTVQWKIDSTDGTYYNPGGNVHLMGVDPLSPLGVVAKHEYGHNVMYNIYGNYMPPNPNCNPHTIPAALSAGCGWTEGWAEFLTSAVNNSPTFYWPSGASLDLEYPTWGTFGWDNGDWPEGRVAGALWDIYDANNDGDDTYSDGAFVNLWDVSYNANDNVMADFWYHWLVRGHSNVSWGPIMDLYQNTINYRGGPFNDDFASAWGIGSVPFAWNGWNTINATTQGNDPPTTCASGSYPRQSRSDWYSYTPPITGNYNINTIGSNYDTVVAAWTGSWGFLTSQGCDDDAGGNWTSSLNVTLYGGATYYIEIMSYGNTTGGLQNLSITLLPPPNDDFDYAFAAGDSYVDYENTGNATTTDDDPSFTCGNYFNGQGSHSVWYTITSPYSRVLTASTLTSNYDTVLGIWTGSRGALSLAACNDDTGGGYQSQTQVAMQAGTTYSIEALGYGAGNGALNFATSLGPICPDFTAPAGVGVEDVALISSLWGQAAGPPYDYDGDGMITIYDITQVTPLWDQDCLGVVAPPEASPKP